MKSKMFFFFEYYAISSSGQMVCSTNPSDENRPTFLCSDPSHRLKVKLSVVRRVVVGGTRSHTFFTVTCPENVCFCSDFLCSSRRRVNEQMTRYLSKHFCVIRYMLRTLS